MNKFILPIIGITLVALIGVFIFSGGNSQPLEKEASTSTNLGRAPDFQLQDYNGNTVRFSDFTGKPLVLNSWAAWCPFCKKELVDFATVQREFGESVVIIAIDRAESLQTAKRYSDELGVTNDLLFLLDPSDSFYQSIGGFSMPETIFVNTNGEIVFHKRGPMELEEIQRRVQELLTT